MCYSDFARLVAPFLLRFYPIFRIILPLGSIIFMNVSANMLGLDNAATPMGLKAIKLQEINPRQRCSFEFYDYVLVLNAAGLCLNSYQYNGFRAQLGAANPADVFADYDLLHGCSIDRGLISVAVYQKEINLLDKTILGNNYGIDCFIAAVIILLESNLQDQIAQYSSLTIFFCSALSWVLLLAVYKSKCVQSFIEGAKEGFPGGYGYYSLSDCHTCGHWYFPGLRAL